MISGVSGLVRSYIVEPVTKWAKSDDISHQGSPRQSLTVVVVVTVQLLVTIAVARSVIFFLLLTSGDVEQNPGPCHAEGSSWLWVGEGRELDEGSSISPG